VKGEDIICSQCIYRLPRTQFHLQEDNPVARRFWGRVELQHASSWLLFNKGSRVQHLIHQLKYKGRTVVGVALGKMMGAAVANESFMKSVDLILPVPLHHSKQHKRGYNQCDFICEGISDSVKIPWRSDYLERVENNVSQTRFSKMQRWENVAEIFAARKPEQLRGKHVLLVDDVITTGSTIEACATCMLAQPGTRVSVLSLATSLGL
jgi:ComF family protein